MLMTEIRPQHGPQEAFLATSADIAIYGGAAGGGKTFALLMEPLRHIANPDFGAVIFRRTSPQITTEGGLWDTSSGLYVPLGASGITQPYRWTFPAGSKIEFHHLQLEKNIFDWQSSQIPFIGWDELTHFTSRQFWYLLSRNRTMCGVRPYIRGTTNPDPDSFVKELIRWYLDAEGEYADLSKAGVIRWLMRTGDDIVWFASRKEALDYACDVLKNPELSSKSFTFIPSSVYDNRLLLESDPGYLANLQALPRVDRERLLKGNWKVRATAGTIFNRNDFEIVDAAPFPDAEIRYWDRAATEPNEQNQDPDWTAGVHMVRASGMFFITDVNRFRGKPFTVKTAIKNTATQDGVKCPVGIEVDPGQAGKYEFDDYLRSITGYVVRGYPAQKAKIVRWSPLSAAAQGGLVKLVKGAWNDAFLTEMENVSEDPDEYAHDDQADAASGAYNVLAGTAHAIGSQKPGDKKPATAGMRGERF
jgi:predicted phage terminase large subunit-like protein